MLHAIYYIQTTPSWA